MKNVLRAHSIDVTLCEDETCGHVHVIFCDKDNEAIADAMFDPTFEFLSDFINTLVEACMHARRQQKTSRVKH